jgi:hypothetical protein
MKKMRLKKVLLLGNSIRISYQPAVKEMLSGIAEVVGPQDNCRYSLYTATLLDQWIEECGIPDIVHWNNGLWDAGHDPNRFPSQIPIEMYCKNLEIIIKRLQRLEAQIIWATTTPVGKEGNPLELFWSWQNNEISFYNSAATELMKKNEIPINNLHELVSSDLFTYLGRDKLHLSERGIQVCAKAVTNLIRDYL